MTDDRKAKGPDGSKLPPFVFAWQTSQSDRRVDNLLIWPLAETRPPGAFARFIVIGSERSGTPPLVVPMDIESSERPPAPGTWVGRNAGALPDSQTEASRSPRMQEDLGSLPLLLRLPFEDRFTVTVKYLVRDKLGGLTRVEEVEMPPFRFRRTVEASSFTTIGFVRGEDTDGPARPIIVAGIERPVDPAGESGDETSMYVEMVDTILYAFEAANGGAERGIAAVFVLAVPLAEDQAIGPAKAILPYAGARIRTTMEIVRRASAGRTEAESRQLRHPRFNLRVGSSRSNRNLLPPGIIFFHWNRTIGFARSESGTAAGRTGLPQPVTLHQGGMRGKDLSFTFDMAGFGDIVGVMSGPPEVIAPVFSEWLNNEAPFFRHELDDWTIVPFLWTGDELMPLNHYIHPDVGEITRIANRDLLAAAHRQRSPERANGPRDIARYLQPASRNSIAKTGHLIEAALAGPHDSVIALDPYWELLHELDRQIKPDDVPREWPRLEELFSFAVFEQVPELHRALVVLQDLRRDMHPDFDVEAIVGTDIHLFAMVMIAIDLRNSSRWLEALSPDDIIAGWEVMKCDRSLLPKLVELFVAPDLTMLSDCFDQRAARRLQIYADYPLADMSAAAQTRHAMGHRHHAALLQEAHDHRSDNGSGRNLLPYEKISAVVELLEARPVR